MNGDPERGRLSPPLLVSGLVLGLDAIACQLLALTLGLTTWFTVLSEAAGANLAVAASPLAAAVVLALWCPAAATLVLGVRTRPARLTGLATAAVVVVAAAAFAADALAIDDGTDVQFLAGLVLMLVNIAVVALLVTPAPPGPGRPPTAEPSRVIDLDADGLTRHPG